jgi:uncharacterized protein (TIGR04255 family)
LRLHFPDQESIEITLPNFGAPPLVETSLGIQFDGLASYTSLAAADFRTLLRSDFPIVEEHPPLEPTFETFGPADSNLSNPRLEIIQTPVSPRFFFISSDGSELVQLQRDRLFFNWRQVNRDQIYPRYGYVRDRLKTQLVRLEQWARDGHLGIVNPTQCEALYLNRMPLRDASGAQCGLSHIFPWFAGLAGTTEDGVFTYRRRLLNDGGEPVARLSFNMRYGTDEEGNREAQLFLIVRGRPEESSIDGCLSFIDAARAVIVHTFTEITSPEAHRIWDRKDS